MAICRYGGGHISFAFRDLVYEIGARVKWYDYYANGDIVRDAGFGLIINLKEYPLTTTGIGDYFILYEVLKDGGSLDTFEHFQLQTTLSCT